MTRPGTSQFCSALTPCESWRTAASSAGSGGSAVRARDRAARQKASARRAQTMAAMKAALALANGAFFGVVDWVLDANWAAWSHF